MHSCVLLQNSTNSSFLIAVFRQVQLLFQERGLDVRDDFPEALVLVPLLLPVLDNHLVWNLDPYTPLDDDVEQVSFLTVLEDILASFNLEESEPADEPIHVLFLDVLRLEEIDLLDEFHQFLFLLCRSLYFWLLQNVFDPLCLAVVLAFLHVLHDVDC
jgi:hypothetical protein